MHRHPLRRRAAAVLLAVATPLIAASCSDEPGDGTSPGATSDRISDTTPESPPGGEDDNGGNSMNEDLGQDGSEQPDGG